MPTLGDLAIDPRFLALPAPDRRGLAAELEPRLATLPPEDQDQFLAEIGARSLPAPPSTLSDQARAGLTAIARGLRPDLGGLSPSDIRVSSEGTALPGLGATLARIVPPIVGGVVGGPVGGVLGGAAGGLLAQELEIAGKQREGVNPARLAVDTALGGIPGLNLLGETAPVAAQIGMRAVEGATVGGAATVATNLSEGIPWHAELIRNVTIGAGLGGVAGLAQLRRGAALVDKAIERADTAEGIPPESPSVPAAGAEPTTLGRGIPLPQPLSGTLAPGTTSAAAPLAPGVAEVGLSEASQKTALTDVRAAGATVATVLAETDAGRSGQRISMQIAEAFGKGLIPADGVKRILDREGMTMADFVVHLRQAVSSSGRELGAWGNTAKAVARMAKENPELGTLLDTMSDTGPPATHRIADALRTMDDTRRALLVTQLATTHRNIISQTQSTVIQAFDFATEALVRGEGPTTAGAELATSVAAMGRAAQENAADIFERLGGTAPKTMRQITRVLDHFPVAQETVMSTPAVEGVLGNITRVLNSYNTFQERFFRRAQFDARLRTYIAREGMDVPTALASPEAIPDPLVQHAALDSLQGTFAAPASGPLGTRMLTAWKALRPLATLGWPFPRFMVNAYTFLLDHSPAGYLRLMGMTGDALVKSDPTAAQKVLSRALTGTTLLAGALAVRNSPYAGDRWFEVKHGDKTLDFRPFAPLSTMLFYAEVAKQLSENPDPSQLRMTTGDLMQGLLSINRIAGTGLVAVDLIRSGSMDRSAQLVSDVLSQYVGGFTVPFGTLKDVLAHVDPGEAVLRDTRTDQFRVAMGPINLSGAYAMRNVPYLSQRLPAAVSPFRSGALTSEYPLVRQLTGLAPRTKRPVESEVDRLAIESARVLPSSGIPEWDRLRAQAMGPVVEKTLPAYIALPIYQRLSPTKQRYFVDQMLSTIRRGVSRDLVQVRPDLALRVRLRGLDGDVKSLFAERGVDLNHLGGVPQ